MAYTFTRRPRRLRASASIRELVRETTLQTADLIAPLFVHDQGNADVAVDSMPGVLRRTKDTLPEHCAMLHQLGIQAVAVFPCIDPALKDHEGSEGLNPDSLVCQTLRHLKSAIPDLTLIADVALDPYTSHGHDGLVDASGRHVLNDPTVERLARMAVLLADAGADVLAPSDMMDGRVAVIRESLDHAGFTERLILSYAAKFASSLYGPFRDAVGSAQAAGTPHLDKRTYQLDPANAREAIGDALLDEDEGADILMVKPAGWYLDVIQTLRQSTTLPVAAYQISGEYSQILAASARGWLDTNRAAEESLLAIKRAGADMILTYFAEHMAKRPG